MLLKKKRLKPIVKAKNQEEKRNVKSSVQPKISQEQNALGNRAIEQREKRNREKEKKSEKVQLNKTLPTQKREEKPKDLALKSLVKADAIETIKTFSNASASTMAKIYPFMGEILNQKLEKEQKEEQKNVVVLELKKGIKNQVKKLKTIEISKPKIVKEEKLSEEEPKVLKAIEHKDKSSIPNNKESIKMLEKHLASGFPIWLRENFSNFLERIKSEDPNVITSMGEVPTISLRGSANPNRMENEKSQAQKNVRETKNHLNNEIFQHSGQEQIKPLEVEHKSSILLSENIGTPLSTPSNDGMKDYVSLELPDKVRKGADALLQPTLEQSTQKLKEESTRLSVEKEEGKSESIRHSKEEVAKLHNQANKEEEQIIVQRRKEIVQKQEEGLDEAYKGVSKFNESAKKEKSSYQKTIDGKVKEANIKAKLKLKEGEKEAKEIQKNKEAEAKEKKRELKEKKKSQGFWSRVGSVIKSAIEVITKAIDTIFNAMRSLIKAVIEKVKQLAVAIINVARTWIVEKLEAFKTWAKGMVDKYVKEYFPNIAKALNTAIDFVVDTAVKGVNAVADELIKGVEALASALGKALDKILAVFQTGLKAAVQVAGAILTGDFKGALKIAIQAVCDTLGIDSKPIFDFFEKAGKNMMRILKSPGTFFKNLILSVGKGIKGFKKNIIKHLKSGIFAWLTGAMSSVEINFPKKFDFKGILSLVMQVMGITYENVKARIIKRYPSAEKVFTKVEKAVSIIKEIAISGPMVLWKKVQEKIGNLKKMVLSGIKGFVAFTLVKEGITWLLSLLNPASAIVKVIKLLFDFVMFLVERFSQIKDFVLSVYNSISAIASGSLAKASKAVEEAMARSLPVFISLIARLAGLGGIGETVQKLIKEAGKPVNRVIDFLVDRAVKFAKKIFGKKKSKKKKRGNEKGKIDKTLGKDLTFSAGNENHKLWIENSGGKIKVMVASKKSPVQKLLKRWRTELKKIKDDKIKQQAKEALAKANTLTSKTMKEAKEEEIITKAILKDKEITSVEEKKESQAEKETIEKEESLKQILMVLFDIFGFESQLSDEERLIFSNKAFENAISEDINKKLWDKFKERKEERNKKAYIKEKFIQDRKSEIKKRIKPRLEKYLKDREEKEIVDELEKYFIKSFNKKSKATHDNFNPDAIKLIEKGDTYIVSYDNKRANETKGSHFEIDIKFGEITKDLPNVNERRVVKGKGLISKPTDIGRGKWDSAGYGFDNAHIIGDQFGGAGKNYGLNIYPSSPSYNRVHMANIENKMAKFFRENLKENQNSYNLTVTADLSHESKDKTKLQTIMEKEFKKDNRVKKKDEKELILNVKNGLIKKLQIEIVKDLKNLPAKFEQVAYKSTSVSNLQNKNICQRSIKGLKKEKDLEKEKACEENIKEALLSENGFDITLGEDKAFEDLRKKFPITN